MNGLATTEAAEVSRRRAEELIGWLRAYASDRINSRLIDERRCILNPGGLTHTSVALRDSLLGVKLPFIELHLSNTFAREKFRHHSYFSDIAVGCIVGLGAQGYELAVQAAAARIPTR